MFAVTSVDDIIAEGGQASFDRYPDADDEKYGDSEESKLVVAAMADNGEP